MHCSILCNQMVKTLINTVPKVWVLVNFLPDHWCKIETDLDTWGSYSDQVHSGHSEGTWSSPYTDTGLLSCYRSPTTFPTSHSHTLKHTQCIYIDTTVYTDYSVSHFKLSLNIALQLQFICLVWKFDSYIKFIFHLLICNNWYRYSISLHNYMYLKRYSVKNL